MLRKYLNYILFGLVVLVVLGVAVRHSQYVHRLVVDMGSPDPKVQSAAALELIKTEQFADAITGESTSTRVSAAAALEALGNDPTVVPDKTDKDAPDYRAQAVKQAVGLLKDTDHQVRDRALLTLQKIGDSTPGNLKELVNGIGDGDNYVRKGVRAAFTAPSGGIGPRPGVVEAIIDKMKADAGTRSPAGDILGSTMFTQNGGNARSVPLLMAILTTRDDKGYKADEGARTGAADALGKVGDAAAVPTLIQSMHTDTPQVRRVAIGAIALIASPDGEASLIEAIHNPDDDKQARAQAAAGLGKIGNPQALSVLVSSLEDSDQDISSAAVAALARAARPVVSGPANAEVFARLTGALGSPNAVVRLGATKALRAALAGGASNDTATTAACMALATTMSNDKNDDDLRAAAASALGFNGDNRAVPALIGMLSDPSGVVGLAARDSLAAIGDSATQALINVIKKGGTNSYYASQALAKQGPSALMALQAAAADSSNPVEQRWAAVALGEIGVSAASTTLRQLAHSSNADVAYVAKEQLSRLGQQE